MKGSTVNDHFWVNLSLFGGSLIQFINKYCVQPFNTMLPPPKHGITTKSIHNIDSLTEYISSMSINGTYTKAYKHTCIHTQTPIF